MEVAALVVSGIALVFSALAWWQTKRQADAAAQGTAISEEQHHLALEAGKAAVLNATIVRTDRGRGQLVVRNRGIAVARGVDVAVEVPFGDTGGEPRWMPSPFPCDVAPATDARWDCILPGSTARHLQISVTWTDERGKHEYKARLSVN